VNDLQGDIRGRALWVLFGCLVCQTGLGFGYAFAPLAPDLLAEFGWSRAALASARAPQIWVIALASPAVGLLTARFGARAVLASSALILGAAFAGVAAMQAWWQFALLWGAVGLGVAGLGDIAVGSVVTRWVVRGRGLALGFVYTGSNLGGFVATRAVAAVADHTSWRVAILCLSAAAVGLLLPAALFAVRERGAGVVARAAAREGPGLPPDRDLDVRAALRTRSFWAIAISLVSFWIYLLALLEHLVLFLVDHGMPRDEAAGHLSNAIFLGIFSKVAFGALSDRLSPRVALLLDFGLLAASSGLLLLLPDPTLIWLFVGVFGFSYAARDVVTPLIVAHCFGVRHLAQIYGVLMVSFLPGGTFGPIFAGWVHDRTGSYDAAFATFALLNALSFAALALVRVERRARTPLPA
jgi:MFS family permease